MAKIRNYVEPVEPAAPTKIQRLYAMACRGISKRSIATKLGCTESDLDALFNFKKNGGYPYLMAYNSGRAVFEEENLAVIEDVIENGSPGLKAKQARENLKTLVEWAPATQGIKLQVEDAASVFTFESYTTEEQEAIQAQHGTDGSNTEED